MRVATAFTIVLLLSCVATWAAEPPATCKSDSYRHFDFWLGQWQVHTAEGQLAGTNRISAQEGGCLLLEQWQNAGGGTGQSYNYYNPGDDQWHQLWVSRGAIIDYAGGLTPYGSMRLEGEITYQADGRKARFSGEWTPTADGSVLQGFKEWDEQSQQWQDWFTGHYTRHDLPQAPVLE